MASSLAFGWFALLADEYAQLGKHVASGAAFIVNFVLVDESGYFDNAAATKPMLHLWSLAVEEQFYIVWPLVLWLAWKRKFNLLTITIVVSVVSFYLNLHFVKTHPTEIFFLPVGRFWELLSGSILAWLLLYKGDILVRFKLWVDKFLVRIIRSKQVVANGSTVSNMMSFFGLLLLTYGVIRLNKGLAFPSAWALIPVLGSVLVIASGSKSWLNRTILMNPVAIWFGLISYPLYLWHWPILSFLQIIDGEIPHRDARISAVLVSVFLAWLTYRFIEKPIRFGALKRKVSSKVIAFVLIFVGIFGFYISTADMRKSHGYDDLLFERKGSEYAIGSSLKWFEGKDNWLYLGNEYNKTVQKLILSEAPDSARVERMTKPIKIIADTAAKFNTPVALFVAANKSSIYPEFLPQNVVPSEKRYVESFLDDMRGYRNLTLHDPRLDLLNAKSKEGMLYFKTGTHYTNKGAYISFRGLMDKLGIDAPKVKFTLDVSNTRGVETGLVRIAGLKEFPVPANENWVHSFSDKNFKLKVRDYPVEEAKTPFGLQRIVTNSNPISAKKLWIVGDSFTNRLSPFLERTFAEVHYIGHWNRKFKTLPKMLIESTAKPDLILIVMAERSF